MNSPFKFLDAYTKEDKDIFFGRSLEIESLFEKIHNGRLLLVYGASGTGKTSLIQCGLANQFQDTDWFPIVIRRNQNIHEATLLSINENAITPIKESNNTSKENIISGFESLYLDFYKPIFLIYDQFEELFISGDENEIISFFELLNSILNSDIQIKIILIIREEYLAQLTNMEHVVPELFNNRQRVEPMSMININEVIINSCNTFDVNLENEITPKLIYEKLIGEHGRVELTHLQVFLDRLYKQASKNDSQNILLSNNLISNVGKLEDVLATFLSEQVGTLSNPKLGWQVLKLFITEKGTKKSVPFENFDLLFKKENIDTTDGLKVINRFTNSRVLRLIGKNNNYEFSHDSLARRVFDRLSIKEKSLLEIKQFINQEYINYKLRKVLLSMENIEYISPYLTDLELPKDKKEFIDKSKKELNRKKKITFLITTFIIIILSFLSVYSYTQSLKSKEAVKSTLEAKQEVQNVLDKLQLEKASAIIKEVDGILERVEHFKERTDSLSQITIHGLFKSAKDILSKYPDNPYIKDKLEEISKQYSNHD